MAGNVSVKLNESLLYKAIYENSRLSSLVGPEGCYLFDSSYNLDGSEALAETFFGVMKHQFMDNAHCETADMRTVLSFCLPDVANCPNTVKNICQIYRNGDLTNKVASHRAHIFYGKKAELLTNIKLVKPSITKLVRKAVISYID